MILTVANTQGGVGKATIPVNIAIARALTSRNVWLVDGDSQQSSQKAISIRSETEREPKIACSSYSDSTSLKSQIKIQKNNFDDIIIDVGGNDSKTLRASLLSTDLLLVPYQPRSVDVWAVDDIANLIIDANCNRNEDIVSYAVLNLADPGSSSDNKEAADVVADYPQLKYLYLSNGEVIKPLNSFHRRERKIRRLQKSVSRKRQAAKKAKRKPGQC
jgi:chromosome partitioning protein